MSGILSVEKALEFREWWRKHVGPDAKWGPIAFTCGTFDILHAGHVDYLQHARQRCGGLLVGVNTDESVQEYKGHRPLIPWNQRAMVVDALRCVTAVVPLEQHRPLALLCLLKPDLYIKGGDYSPGDLRSADTVREYGGEVLVLPKNWHVSSSQLKQRIKDS